MKEKLTRRESFKAILALPVLALFGALDQKQSDPNAEWRNAVSQLVYFNSQMVREHHQVIVYLTNEHPPQEDYDPGQESTI